MQIYLSLFSISYSLISEVTYLSITVIYTFYTA